MPPFSNWRKQLGRELVLPSGKVELAAQRRPRVIPLHQVHRHVALDCEIVCAVIVTIFLPVLVHDGVENPVKPAFNNPMRTGDLAEAFGRQRCAEQVIGALALSLCLRCLGVRMTFPIAARPDHRRIGTAWHLLTAAARRRAQKRGLASRAGGVSRYICSRVTRRPATPWVSIARCQARNSSTESS